MEKRTRKTRKPSTVYLGKQTNRPIRHLDLISWTGGRIVVHFDCSEFSSFCPVTHQPDYATFVIAYMPNKALVETKSLKLFLWSYRNRKAFNEMLVQEIHDELQVQLRPKYLFVQGRFHARGGIAVTASAGDIPVFKGE